jgi:hypothetical protein
MRYEDLRADPERALARLIHDIGLVPDAHQIASAVRNNTVAEMRKKEDRASDDFFGEAVDKRIRFVQSGSVDRWRSELPSQLAAAVAERMSHAMDMGGYS